MFAAIRNYTGRYDGKWLIIFKIECHPVKNEKLDYTRKTKIIEPARALSKLFIRNWIYRTVATESITRAGAWENILASARIIIATGGFL